ncbi:MAG: cobalt ECF transporter T component CbiQ [Thermodesulfovibrionia bacterium]
MLTFDKGYFNLGYLDTLAYKDTFIHRLDPRTKLITAISFVFMVVSFPRYELSGLIPFFIFPVFMAIMGEVPAGFILKRVILVSPFVLFVAIFNPLLDTTTMYNLDGIRITGGWVSFFSIIMRFVLTISIALILMATTPFHAICHAIERLSVPRVFVVQLLFLYRYIFVLAEEGMRMVRAVNMRRFKGGMHDMNLVINLLGVLFVKTMERAERIYQCMSSRGFDGEVRLLQRYKIRFTDIAFAIITITAFIAFRRYDVTKVIGEIVLRLMQWHLVSF